MKPTRFLRGALRYAGNLLVALSERIPYSTVDISVVDILERNEKWVTCRAGEFLWRLDATHYLDREILKTGVFEATSTRWVQQIVKPGMIVADVGANFGYYTILLSRLVGSTGQVYAFEPSRRFRERLVDHLERNRCTNVLVVDCGLSDSSESKELYHEDSCSPALFSMGGQPLDVEVEMAKLRTLDDYVGETKIQRMDFMKVDIEGYESRFVKGAEETLRKFRPIILMEFNHLHLLTVGSGVDRLADQLKVLGYVLYNERTGKPYKFPNEFLIDAMNCAHSVNIICLPNQSNNVGLC